MQHLAIIPDGNRRWAMQNKLESIFGHQRGMETVKSAIKVCIKNSIQYLSFYTFSLENFRRSNHEKNYLFSLITNGTQNELADLIKHGVRIRFIGNRLLFPESIQQTIQTIEKKTEHLNTLNLNLLFCYGAKSEIVHAAKLLAHQVKNGILNVEDIDEEKVHGSLWTAGMPDPDLIIRTGGVVRLSNFLLFQAAYSELSFLDCHWPEITEEKLEGCIQEFKSTQRNFGH